MPLPHATALENTCALHTPSPLLDRAFLYAKDNIARCMRYYTLGWGMSNAPHHWTLVVGRDTGWMAVGTDYVAPWFAPEALKVFCDRQKPNGQMLEYINMETGFSEDYGLNVADNTPLLMWALWHHWRQFADEGFREAFVPSMRAAADFLVREIGPRGLILAVPAGVETRGIASWRNIIPNTVLAGEVTELNALAAMALRYAAEFTNEPRYAAASERLAEAINTHLWTGEGYLLHVQDEQPNAQITGDSIFTVLCGVAPPERARIVLERLAQPDFWTKRGLRTVPNSDPAYDPIGGVGLLGGSWPNLTLWYAATVAPYDPDRALAALEIVAQPVVEPEEGAEVNGAEFAEFFHGETGANCGMPLSPWVAPTFLWAVMEGLLGVRWEAGTPTAQPHWPRGWEEARVERVPAGKTFTNLTLRRDDRFDT